MMMMPVGMPRLLAVGLLLRGDLLRDLLGRERVQTRTRTDARNTAHGRFSR
jgi:hypothetical protein